MSHYNILSLDGGGIRGVMTTRIVSWVEEQLQQASGSKDTRLIDFFDFFIGTSTGGLMTCCYLMPDDDGTRPRYSAKDVEDLYRNLGDKVFSLNLWQKVSRGHGITSAKYPAKDIEQILNDNFGDLQLNQLLRPCIISAYDMRRNKRLLFRQHRATKSPVDNFYVRDICRATTSAPTYFPPCLIKSLSGDEYLCVDGGVIGGNPVLSGYSELRRVDSRARASGMNLLSLSTGNYVEKYDEKDVMGWGKLEWYRPLVNLMVNNNILNADFQMKMIFRENPNNYMRVDPVLDAKELSRIDLASQENMQNLQQVADNYIKMYKQEMERFIGKLYDSRRTKMITQLDAIADVKVERYWLKEYPEGVPSDIDPDIYANLGELVDEASHTHDTKVAYEQFGNKMTFAEVHKHSESFAAYLQNGCGVVHGTKVAIMMPNCPQYPIAIFATLKLGAIVVNVNPLYTAEEILHVLDEINPDVLIIWDGCSLRVEDALGRAAQNNGKVAKKSPKVIITALGDMLPSYKGTPLNLLLKLQGKVEKGNPPNSQSFNNGLALGSTMNLYRPKVSGDDVAFLQLTGGTTGKPKAAMLTHRNMIANMLQAKAFADPRLGAQESDSASAQQVALTALPLYHIFALLANGLLFYHLGLHNMLVANPRDLKGLIKQLGKYQFSGIDAVNTLFKAMLATPGLAKLDFSKLWLTLGGGMAVQKDVADEWQKVTGCFLNQAYGLTEASPAVAINPHTAKKYNGSIGLPLPSTDVAILDDKLQLMPKGEKGNLYVRGPQVMKGYWNNPDDTSRDLSLDGWLNTGDIAYMNAKGYIYIVDRAKDIIIVSGFNVYPNEVEEVVDSYEKVYESCCVGVPDEHSGEAVKAFVVLQPGMECTKEELIAFTRKKLTGYKTPDKVEFVKELPKSAVGKILRRAVPKE
ncbi:MAG: AMP-binding protein [Gammaproteobacteria bacterium]|nr:AMP-binding protein [Gammaproteobacteria bacterium]